MKNNCLILLALSAILLALPAKAQNKGEWEISAGMSISEYDRFPLLYPSNNAEILYGDHSTKTTWAEGEKLSHYMSNPIVLPTLSLTVGYRFPDSILGVYMSGFCSHAWNRLRGGPAALIERETILHIMPQMRFYYVDDPSIKLFGSVGVGARYRFYAEILEGDKITKGDTQFSFEVSPIGISTGKDHWQYSASLGYGKAWAGILLGVGYRF